jgi:hypothetical protein
MRKLLLVSLVVLAVPATAPAKGSGSGHRNAAKQCKALRAEMGANAFRAAFGTKQGKNALDRCVSTKRKARKAARKNARRACRGDGLRGRAMKRCVRSKLAQGLVPRPADFQNAVEECREDQAESPEEFASEYGDGSNAFGKCVAEEASDDDEGDDVDEPETGDDEGGAEPDAEEPDEPDEL